MARIRTLDAVCISKIAAGEVIERPASVVKELLENAIDAGANEIRIAIKNGGKDLIEIRDNGHGITPKDLPLSIHRHTTSKIQSENDLDFIATMGFRGEALYSIASVSRLSITSRTPNDELATTLSCNGDVGIYQITESVMASPGTLIRVRDLFHNFIVRRKFLKKASIEQGYIYDVCARYAVAHPKIVFTLVSEDEVEFQTIKGQHSHLPAIQAAFGSEIANSLIDIGISQRNGITLHGYVSKPGFHRRNRRFQYFYLNGRPIISELIQSALEEGCGAYLMKSEFPIAYLFLEMERGFDVNIHPQKREVLFFDENNLKTVISSSISLSFRSADIVPNLTPSEPKTSGKLQTSNLDITTVKSGEEDTIYPEYKHSELVMAPERTEAFISAISGKNIVSDSRSLFGSDVKFRGHLGKEFILLEDLTHHDLIILDFHAADERINLEKLIQSHKTGKIVAQTFLKPFNFRIQSYQLDMAKNAISELSSLGFDLRIPKGKSRMIEVHAIPKLLAKADLQKFLTELLETEMPQIVQKQLQEVLNLIACHSAHRVGETLSFPQAKRLLSDLAKVENPHICAHGRPTFFRVNHHEMLRKVRRI
ncbi:MAG: DNA mismatch repair endonuclease MutL [Candidatus Heimdallarchaeota archaeon]